MEKDKKYFGLYLMVVFIWTGCAGPIEELYPPQPDEPFHSIYLLNHNDWHTGIVIQIKEIPTGVFPEKAQFSDFQYLEVGWGDRDYYPMSDPGFWVTLKAGLWPTQSVLHVVGFNGSIENFFPESEIIEIHLSNKGFENLIGYIDNTFLRKEMGNPVDLGQGLYKNSRFYMAKEKFHLFKTCNVWVAQALRSAGCPITPFYAISAGNTIYQAQKFGTPLSHLKKENPVKTLPGH
ncbi:MAG TPA: DUF2459 domain-containing protein [Nitrospiria bacterium]|jgi:uncharacterized protein (TIGR02117 family)